MKVETTGTTSDAIVNDWQCWRTRVIRSGGGTSRTPQPIPGVTNAVRPTIRLQLRLRHLVFILLVERRAQPPARMGTLLVRVCGTDAGRAAAICSESSFRRRPAYWVTSVWGTWEATPKRLSTEWFKLRLYRFNALRPFPLAIATSAAVLAFPKLPSF